MQRGLVSPPRHPYVRNMVGQGRHPILAVRSIDPVLSLVSTIGLAGSVGTGLVIDMLAPSGGEGRTLRDLMADGPSLEELSPGRHGVGLLRGGGVDVNEVSGVVEALARRWPAVVVRVDQPAEFCPTVPVIPLYPGPFLVSDAAIGVWQPVVGGSSPAGPGPVLPRLRPTVLRRLLAGSMPRRSRWVAAWRPVWEMPWG